MKKILAFAGSNSSTSINKELLEYTINKIPNSVSLIDLIDFEAPMYSIDQENDKGIPENIIKLSQKIRNTDVLIITVNEHNGSASAFFKNHIDWLSRHDRNFLKNTKVALLSTSPGRGGAKMALKWAAEVLPRFGAEIICEFSLASFNHAYSKEKGIFDPDQKQVFDAAIKQLSAHI